MNTKLSVIQDAFQDQLLTGKDRLGPHLSEGGHMAVYDHAYRARLLDILANDYPALHTLLGDDQFGLVINDYLDSHPSQKRSVRWLGQHVSDWLRQTIPWSNLTEAVDMAAFEWALGLAFDAPDGPIIDQADLAATAPADWPKLSFSFHPALQIITLRYDVTPFQQAIAQEKLPEEAPEALDMPGHWAVWRDHEELNVLFRKLEPDEAAMLENARRGADFTVLCDTISFSADGDEAAMRTAELVQGWVSSGWISQLKTSTA